MDNSNNSGSVDATKGKYDSSSVSHVDINNSGYNKGTGIFTGLNRKALPKTIRAQQSSVRETRPTKVLEEARKVMGLPSATLALITIFIQSNHFCFIESMVESEFSSRPEGPSAEQREFLLQELNGAHLRLSVNVDPPWMTEERDSNGTVYYKGNVVEFANYIAQAFNATYTFVPMKTIEENKFGARLAGLKLLINNEVDIITRPTLLSILFYSLSDSSLPLSFQTIKLMVPWPKEESLIVAPVRPFQDQVWICLPISIFIVAFILVLIQKYYNKGSAETGNLKRQLRSPFWKHLMYIVVGEGDWSGWNQLSFRLVQGAWCMAAIVLFNAYCSTLISYLVSPKLMPVAKTYQDIVSGSPQKLKLLAGKNELLALFALQATKGYFKGLGDLLRRYPESLFSDRVMGFEQMLTGDYAFIDAENHVIVFMAKAFEKYGQCKFTVSNENIDRMYPVVWSFQKKWRYTDVFNHRMRWLAPFGIVNFWTKRLLPHTEICKVENQRALKNGNDPRKVLTLGDLSGPFILLAFGLSLSFFIFLLERLYYKYKLHNSHIINLELQGIVVFTNQYATSTITTLSNESDFFVHPDATTSEGRSGNEGEKTGL